MTCDANAEPSQRSARSGSSSKHGRGSMTQQHEHDGARSTRRLLLTRGASDEPSPSSACSVGKASAYVLGGGWGTHDERR